MTKHLYLLRHAESPQKQLHESDKQRGLTASGLNQSLLIGKYLLENKIVPDLVICSTAIRARATAQRVTDILKLDERTIVFKEELYEASTRTFLGLIHQIEDSKLNVLVVGHNPGITHIAEYICGGGVPEMQPAGLVTITVPSTSWAEVSKENCNFIQYISPSSISV